MSHRTILSSPAEQSEAAPSQLRSRAFLSLLLLITIAGFAVRVYIASQRYMSWDEWEHIFIASGARGIDVRFELNIDAHPPLHIQLLRLLMHLGHSKLLYRSISLLSGTGIIALIGIICRRICAYPAVALLCAAAFAFSEVALTVGVEVRSYELTVFFVLAAFSFYLELARPLRLPVEWRPYLLFSTATALAVASHYFAGLFLGACCLVAPFLLFGASRDKFRGIFKSKPTLQLVLSLLFPLSVIAYFYLKHASKQPIQGYLAGYYWDREVHESRVAFLLRNSKNFWNLFSPVPIQSDALFLITVGGLLCAAVWIVYASRSRDWTAQKMWIVAMAFPMLIILELMVFASIRAYPYGGLVRHQYIVAPFLMIAAFLLLDRFATLMKFRVRVAVLTLAAAGIAVNAAMPRPRLIEFPGQLIYSDEFTAYHQAVPNARAVYLDRFGAIAFFSQTDNQPRRFVKSISDVVLIDWYHIKGGSPEGTEIFYDKYRGSFDLSDQRLYHSLASVLRQSGLQELTLFYFRPGNINFEETAEQMRQMIADKAASQGVTATKIVIDHFSVYASFRLQGG